MQIFIVEDDIINIEIAKAVIDQCGYKVCGYAYNYVEAIDKIPKKNPDLVLVDITLPGSHNGIDIGKWLSNKKIPHIYLTSHKTEQKIKDAVKTGPINYIIKPIEKETLKTSVELLKANFYRYQKSLDEDYIVIETDFKKEKLYIHEILYATTDDNSNYSNIHLSHEKISRLRISLKTLHDNYENFFLRIHRSFIVNPSKIKTIIKDSIQLNNGEILPLSRKHKNMVWDVLKKRDVS